MPTFGLPAALVLAAASLTASLARAEPVRPYTQWHIDFYALSVSGADLGTVPVYASARTLTGRDIGVTGVQTLGICAPHFGVGVEIPHALFYVHGGWTYLGRGTGQPASDDEVDMLFAQLTLAPRLELGPFVLSLGPTAGIRSLTGGQAKGWTTGVQPALGGELDARVRVLTGRGGGKRTPPGPPTMTMDFFIHVTGTGFEGASWMVAFGGGLGSLPGR